MKPSEGVAKIDAAVARGRAAINRAADMFQGTVPPRPWPSPELYKAIDDTNEVRDFLDVFVRKGDPEFSAKTPQVARVVEEVNRRVAAVDAATLALEERRELVAQRTPAAAIEKVKAVAKSPKWVGLAAIAFLFWQAEESQGRSRRR